jgi:hypothetical protein
MDHENCMNIYMNVMCDVCAGLMQGMCGKQRAPGLHGYDNKLGANGSL